jgi:hypothetical protein
MTTKNDKEIFDSILIAMAEIYDQTLSEERLSLYFEALKDMTLEQFRESANRVAKTSRFFPKPVDFRESITTSIDDKAMQALIKLEDACKRIGYDKSVVFDDPIIHMVVRALGDWQAICVMSEDEWKWKRKEFMSLYRVFSANPREYPEKLIGYHDHKSTINGLHDNITTPILIGDEHKAMAVLTHKQSETKLL